ncbi:hypothetical protein [Agrobacterium radiobacter]|uniref:hypothetical protein n=1 Tax=Agrobacterium radiobacter TaxID=362 RepID=UPI0016066A1C|nr:hypothetical protein [Agrobacterium radiobacter]MBB4402516.1 hypothetical protein [Agrobacterium radiobacter]MBB5588670.1 hypothetical protein [Agrobacterium radiobacter]
MPYSIPAASKAHYAKKHVRGIHQLALSGPEVRLDHFYITSALSHFTVKALRIKLGALLVVAAPLGTIGNHLFNINGW